MTEDKAKKGTGKKASSERDAFLSFEKARISNRVTTAIQNPPPPPPKKGSKSSKKE